MRKPRKSGYGAKWAAEEDNLLLAAVKKHRCKNWKKIAQDVGTRGEYSCYQHWFRVLNPYITKGRFCDDELALLAARVRMFGEHSWATVAEGITGRTDTQCRARWTDLCCSDESYHKTLVAAVRDMNNEEAARHLPLTREGQLEKQSKCTSVDGDKRDDQCTAEGENRALRAPWRKTEKVREMCFWEGANREATPSDNVDESDYVSSITSSPTSDMTWNDKWEEDDFGSELPDPDLDFLPMVGRLDRALTPLEFWSPPSVVSNGVGIDIGAMEDSLFDESNLFGLPMRGVDIPGYPFQGSQDVYL